MKVFKFGGASINSKERIENVATIIESYKGEKVLIIISAMGKITNALEKVAEAFYSGDKEAALSLFDNIKEEHLSLLARLTGVNKQRQSRAGLNDLFTEVEWLLHDKPVREYDYYL
jgi:aspartate kinase